MMPITADVNMLMVPICLRFIPSSMEYIILRDFNLVEIGNAVKDFFPQTTAAARMHSRMC